MTHRSRGAGPPADYTSIVITGASSGIGAALALRLAAPGRALALIARDTQRLDAIAAACRGRGAACMAAALDVRDRDGLREFLGEAGRARPLDLVIANAGVLGGRPDDEPIEDGDSARAVLDVNLLAAVDTVYAALPALRRRERGAIVLVASLAAFMPLPDAPAYSASKAGLVAFGLALREAVAAEGIRVVVACPGFVATGMAARHVGPRPGEISADDAAARILAGLERNQALIGFPTGAYRLLRVRPMLPEFLRRLMTRRTRFYVEPLKPPDGSR